MRFVLITRPDLDATNHLIRAATAARDLPLTMLVPGAAGGADLGGDGPRLIYTAATDYAARLVEKMIARPGDALLHDPHFNCDAPLIRMQGLGLPVPRTVYLPEQDPGKLAAQAAWLGGFPIVLKHPGTEGGTGVALAHDLADLSRQLSEAPVPPVLQPFIEHRRCWRVTVLAGRVLAASAYRPAAGDFRTNAPGAALVATGDPPPGAKNAAIRAVEALRLDFGGVDLIEGIDGALTIAEVNFPCYFAQQQEETGTDIAGALVDHLSTKPV